MRRRGVTGFSLYRKGALHGFGLSFNHPQEGARGALGAPAALLPVLNGVQFEAEPLGEFRLRQPKPLADPPDVNPPRYVRNKTITLASPIIHPFPSAPQDPLPSLRHLS